MNLSDDLLILEGARTPIGVFLGSLSTVSATALGVAGGVIGGVVSGALSHLLGNSAPGRFLLGGVGGAIAKTITAPFERIKLMMRLRDRGHRPRRQGAGYGRGPGGSGRWGREHEHGALCDARRAEGLANDSQRRGRHLVQRVARSEGRLQHRRDGRAPGPVV